MERQRGRGSPRVVTKRATKRYKGDEQRDEESKNMGTRRKRGKKRRYDRDD